MDLHSFLDGITLPDHSLLANCNGSPGLFLEDSPNTSVDSLCGSGSSAFPYEDQLPFGPGGEGELLPALPFMEFSQETRTRGRSAVPGRCRAGPESPAPKSTGKSAKARTAAAMERNRRGARKFRERQKQKFSDLTNRVEMLETELIAMKLCKLKMEADKTEAELQVKEMEKTLTSLQNGHSSQEESEPTERRAEVVDDGPEASVISVPDGPTLAAHEISTLSFTQAFAIYKNYVFALRACLKEMEATGADHHAQLEKLEYLTRDLGILARCMQRTSNVPLWRLYAKQECCPGPSSDLEYEREIMGKLDVSDEQKIALDKSLRKYRSELHALAAERMSLNAVLAKAAVPGKSDSVQKAHGVMWALKGSLAKEPLMTETFLGSCLAILKPIQIALLIVAYFPRTVWPNLFALCSTINPRNGGSATHRLHI
ncbi:hypothetical protein CVIRNUC_006561 [Coccomyxa viridis]|uniref:BZIP domain-containing protein n=1 Tax=Coccomyxa viridis TaxID=1274662 RepID=A0AAV1I8H1_9CHLO|nr:hypothetical protein CVIRNUC_006561 [Coccomyxa viridis]